MNKTARCLVSGELMNDTVTRSTMMSEMCYVFQDSSRPEIPKQYFSFADVSFDSLPHFYYCGFPSWLHYCVFYFVFITLPPILEQSIVMSVCVFVCVCVCVFACLWSYLQYYTSNLHIFVRVTSGHGSVLLRQQSDTLFT